MKTTEAKTTEAKLSTGKVVRLARYGWHQPDEQFQRFGPLSEAEAAEAWALVDARSKAGDR